MKKLELSELKFPAMRNELISCLLGLSSAKYQYNAWVERANPDLAYDEFNYVVHFLYDDTDLATDADSWVGLIFRGGSEALAVSEVVRRLDVIFEKYGTALSDAEYLTKPEWIYVIESSKNALLELS
ncbi:SCO4402 family protein [Pseudomonas quasicaspiana]|uniref:SCO4402 family protein n=1 Tax=Pseudomonas quasicaspiana TaxID=2829821 RepID=UPI001E411192|nr:hypothetical protein [Pseudomonas quasicaspiana]MCD5977716.1 hypothetical protein [Pseudomonas quasicaspiana]